MTTEPTRENDLLWQCERAMTKARNRLAEGDKEETDFQLRQMLIHVRAHLGMPLDRQRPAPARVMLASARMAAMDHIISPPLINFAGHYLSMAQVQDDGDGRGAYALDHHNRRWLLDGSGECA